MHFYYSTLAPFYHISQEKAQNMPRYYTVQLCIALQNPGFTGFLAEGLKKTNFDVIFLSGIIINLLFDCLTYNTRGHFAHRLQLAKYPHVLYVKPSNKMYIYIRA